MKAIKVLCGLFPGGKEFYRRRKLRRRRRRLERLGNAEERFTHFYESNKWGDPESRSGAGSTETYTHNLRKELPGLLEKFEIARMLDAPCGDYNWFHLVERPEGVHYTGGDIVQSMIAANQERYGNESTAFVHLDIVKGPLPTVDLWMCRDCLFHLSNDEALTAIRLFLKSDIRYLLTTTHPECEENSDIPTGAFRLMNLRLPPYSFGEPLLCIDDWIEGFPVRHLALWEREVVARAVEANPTVAYSA